MKAICWCNGGLHTTRPNPASRGKNPLATRIEFAQIDVAIGRQCGEFAQTVLQSGD
jgi:hypothetical protein